MPDYICSHDGEWRKGETPRLPHVGDHAAWSVHRSQGAVGRQAAREQVEHLSARADSRMCVVDSGWMCSPAGRGVRGGRFEQAAPRSWDGAVDCVLDQEPLRARYMESRRVVDKIILEAENERGTVTR